MLIFWIERGEGEGVRCERVAHSVLKCFWGVTAHFLVLV